MKTTIATILCLLLFAPAYAVKTVKAKQKVKLLMPGTSGSNGAGVAWNPGKKVYYACFAGNSSYPLVMFSKKGKVINSDLETGVDTRGFWFNKADNRLEGTIYGGAVSSAGYFYRSCDSKGTPGADTYVKFPSMTMPDDQSVGAYDASKDEIVFRDREFITRFSKKDGASKGSLTLNLPDGVSWGSITEYVSICTGKKGEEYAVLNHEKGMIYLFDATTGNVTKTVELPEEAPDPETFNFSYANGMFWVFSTISRTWYGYNHP